MNKQRTSYEFSKTGIVLLTLLIVFVTFGQAPDPQKMLDEAIALYQQGTAVSLRASLPKFDEARRLFREKGDKPNEVQCFYLSGVAYASLSENQKALESYMQALQLSEAPRDKAVILNDIGEVYRSLGDTQKALDFFDQAMPLFKAAGDLNGQATILGNTGSVYLTKGEGQKALELYNQALPLFKTAGNKSGEARMLANLGAVYIGLGENQKALETFNLALPLLRSIDDKYGESRALISIGKLYFDLGDKQKALEYLNQASPLFKAIGDRNGEAVALNNLGMVYSNLGEKQKALEIYDQALTLLRSIGDKNSEAVALNNIGLVYIDLGENQKALEYVTKALMLSKTVGNIESEARALNNFGSIYIAVGEYKKASEFYNQALPLLRALGDSRGEAIALNNVMYTWEALGNNRLAIFYGKQSVNKRQELRRAIQGLEAGIQQTFLGTIEGTYKTLADILITEGRFPEAQAVLDLLKDQEYRQLTRSGEKGETVPYSTAETDVITKIDKLVLLEKERSEIQKGSDQLSTEREARLEKLRLDIAEANKAFDDSLNALGKAEASVSARVDEIKGGQEIQSALAALDKETKSGVVALYTVLGSQEDKAAQITPAAGKGGQETGDPQKSKFGWVIMVTDKSYKAYPIDVKDLEKNVFDLRTALSSDKYDPRPLAEKIYNAIFRQTSEKQKRTLETDLQEYLGPYKEKTIMWSLDGMLRYIPMSALHDGKKYLIEDYRNVLFTKQSFLWLTRENQPNRRALGLGVSDKRENFPPLPGVKTELETIVRESNKPTGILNGSIKLNDEFKKQTFFSAVGQGVYPVVHIASHYSFNPAQQEASFLLLGDGRLTFGELKENKNLFGTVDLLTLSACDTGVSGNGKEAEGFAYLAQSLGAKSVIASLWEVSDTGTPELMIRFYKLLANNRMMEKGEAFREAQLSLLNGTEPGKADISQTKRADMVGDVSGGMNLPSFVKDEKKPYAHPHYWASFVLIGNWR